MRELIREARKSGTTVLVNTHLLGQVQEICDHLAILSRGRVVASGPLPDFVRDGARSLEARYLQLVGDA